VSDPASPPVALRGPSLEDLKRLPIGYFEDDGLTPVTPETRQTVQDAVRVLRQQGFDVRPFRPKALEQARKLWWTFFVQCGAIFFAPSIRGHEEKLSPIFREYLGFSQGLPLTSEQLLTAWAEADVIRGKLLEQMREFPVLLCPVCAIPAFRHGERSWTVEGQRVEYLDAMRYSQWFNLLAAPAAVVPVGQSPEGLPIGVQVVARPFEDEVAMGVAAAIDREFGYRVPPMTE
jgi:amidase